MKYGNFEGWRRQELLPESNKSATLRKVLAFERKWRILFFPKGGYSDVWTTSRNG